MKISIIAFTILAYSLGYSQTPVCLQYEGKRSSNGTHVGVKFQVIHRAEGIYVSCSSNRVSEFYLAVDGRALQIYQNVRDTGTVANITNEFFGGMGHVPYLPLELFGLKKQNDSELSFLTGGTVSEPATHIFSIPKVRNVKQRTTLEVSGKQGGVSAEIMQTGIFDLVGFRIPKASSEKYVDVRGQFEYDWSLKSHKSGPDCPKLPTFEEPLGKQAVVQDRRGQEIFSFAFSESNGSFESQYKRGQEIRFEIERQDSAESTSVWVSATIAGIFATVVSVILFRRYRATKT